MIKDKQTYLDLFHTTEQTLEGLVGTALAQGGDYADLFFENTTYSDLMLRDGQVSSGGFHVESPGSYGQICDLYFLHLNPHAELFVRGARRETADAVSRLR